jgi:hypothetical protein
MDKKRFTEILTMMGSVYGVELKDAQIMGWFKLLENTDIEIFEQVAMDYMRSDSAFMPKPGQILTLISLMDGRPTPEEAFLSLRFDEESTNVWTDEMRVAYFAAYPAMDKIGQRMAFLEVYRREVAKARAAGTPVKWSVSLGLDKSGRELAILDAVERGSLLPKQAKHHLPYLTAEEIENRVSLPAMTLNRLLTDERQH